MKLKIGVMQMRKRADNGYILPATILLSVAISIITVVFVEVTAIGSATLNNQLSTSSAQEAARAGVLFANGCIQTNSSSFLSNNWTQLTPGTDCSGNANGSSSYIGQTAEWRSTFTVSTPTAVGSGLRAISTGTVQILNGTTVIKTYTANAVVTLPANPTSFPVATGNAVTDIEAENTDCAIANGLLYCWGSNNFGQLGQGDTTDRATPTLVAGALAGKTVTNASVSDESVCAIADGTAYCWGGNEHHQLGDGTIVAKSTPTAVAGGLAGKLVSEISTAPFMNPVFGLSANRHTCANASGVAYCWGANDFSQNGQASCGGSCNTTTTETASPLPVYGYNNGNTGSVLYQKKSDRVGAAAHIGCSVAAGTLYCWGAIPPSANKSLPYNSGGDFTNKLIDSNTWQIGDDETCAMANTSYICYGVSAALGGLSGFFNNTFNFPMTVLNSVDITTNDSGEDTTSNGTSGMYCWIHAGVAYCIGTSNSGTGFNNQIRMLNTSAGLSGNTPTKIAGGMRHGCVVANGKLLCWGNGQFGRLADGSTANHTVNYPTVTGGGVIGATSGNVASGVISVGGNHSCGVANGQLYCWGQNTYGQLGTGDNADKYTPISVPDTTGVVVTKVSAGTSHTCGIINGQLYCWGRNNNGQLGTGDYVDYNEPQLVGGLLSDKRVTDVSAGDTGTCAVANGQAYCWGLDSSNQLGDGATTTQNVPELVSGQGDLTASNNVTAITMGTTHACAVSNGDGFCWGNNANGRTGLNTTTGTQPTPKRITTGSPSWTTANNITPTFSAISAGSDFTCAIINLTVRCWGNNANGRTGLNTTSGSANTPTILSGAPGGYYATSISAGGSHACAVLNGNSSATNGNLWCWGTGANGRLGNNGTANLLVATVINGGNVTGKSTLNVAAGATSSCSVSNGNILCWGTGANGRLGNGNAADSLTPTITSAYNAVYPYKQGVYY